MITADITAKVANIVLSDAGYGALRMHRGGCTIDMGAPTNISYRNRRYRNNSAQFRKYFLT
jgi:hypothetical protein